MEVVEILSQQDLNGSALERILASETHFCLLEEILKAGSAVKLRSIFLVLPESSPQPTDQPLNIRIKLPHTKTMVFSIPPTSTVRQLISEYHNRCKISSLSVDDLRLGCEENLKEVFFSSDMEIKDIKDCETKVFFIKPNSENGLGIFFLFLPPFSVIFLFPLLFFFFFPFSFLNFFLFFSFVF